MDFKEPTRFRFSTNCEWRLKNVNLTTQWRESVLDKIHQIYDNEHNSIPKQTVLSGLFRLFRQGILKNGIKMGPIKINGTDLERLHSIIVEIDTRRVFYEEYAFEEPQYCTQSVLATREKIREFSRGTRADNIIEALIQDIQQALSDFLSNSEKSMPSPTAHWHNEFKEFITDLSEMRLKVWTIIGIMVKHVGDIITPKHLPKWLYDEVKSIEKSSTY